MIVATILNGVDLDALAECTSASWQPVIGDPDIASWITVVFYLITFGLCAAVIRIPAIRIPANTGGAARSFWLLLCFLMLFLAINKQLDLQSLASAGARCVAQVQDWYSDRGAVLLAAIGGLGIAALLTGLYFLWALRHDLRRNFLALTGLTTVLVFVMIRAVGFQYVDILIGIPVGPVHRFGAIHVNNILEVSGLVLISLNAILLLQAGPRRRRSKQT